jgi:hypothetical protein
MSTTTHPAYPLTALCCAQALAFCELAMQLPVGTPAATNVAGILGCLGQFPSVALARPEIAEALVRLLGDGLDGLGEGGGDPWLTAEALNSVFDVFAGDSRGACQPPFQCWSFPSVHFFCYVVENYVCVISSSHILLLLGAEPESNAAANGAGLMAALEAAAPRLEACVARGLLESDAGEKIAEAGENLMRFLEYKAGQ